MPHRNRADVPEIPYPHRGGTGSVYVLDGQAPSYCTIDGALAGSDFGRILAEAGDVDQNRKVDFLIGQPEYSGPGNGTVFLKKVLR